MRGQSSTEYLITLALVIVIGVLVVAVLGGIPGVGGGIDERANSATLSTLPVGISDETISEAKTSFVFTNNQQEDIRIDNVTVGGEVCFLIGSNTDPINNPTLKPGQSQEILCGSYGSDGGADFTANIAVDYTNLKTNAQYTLDDNYQIAGTTTSLDCPTGFIPVPGGFILADGSTVDDFCVMKYEAKAQVDADGSIDADGGASDSDNWGIATHTPTSVAEGRPWVEINHTNAIAECQSMGSGYDLISDYQWMVLAENILNTPINDLNATAEGPQLGNGNSNSPQSYNASTEPEVSGCNLWKSLDNETNAYSATCQLRGTASDFGYTHDGASSWNMPYDSSTDSRAKLRTHVLSNGEVVWDLAGNAYQWTKTMLTNTSSQSGVYYDSSPDFTSTEWMQPSQAQGSAFGFGYYDMDGSTNVVALRGAGRNNGAIAGVFSVLGGIAPSGSVANIGFRCVYNG